MAVSVAGCVVASPVPCVAVPCVGSCVVVGAEVAEVVGASSVTATPVIWDVLPVEALSLVPPSPGQAVSSSAQARGRTGKVGIEG